MYKWLLWTRSLSILIKMQSHWYEDVIQKTAINVGNSWRNKAGEFTSLHIFSTYSKWLRMNSLTHSAHGWIFKYWELYGAWTHTASRLPFTHRKFVFILICSPFVSTRHQPSSRFPHAAVSFFFLWIFQPPVFLLPNSMARHGLMPHAGPLIVPTCYACMSNWRATVALQFLYFSLFVLCTKGASDSCSLDENKCARDCHLSLDLAQKQTPSSSTSSLFLVIIKNARWKTSPLLCCIL